VDPILWISNQTKAAAAAAVARKKAPAVNAVAAPSNTLKRDVKATKMVN
jgi:hypothetical protein